jgi:hypothetical protein
MRFMGKIHSKQRFNQSYNQKKKQNYIHVNWIISWTN